MNALTSPVFDSISADLLDAPKQLLIVCGFDNEVAVGVELTDVSLY